MICYNSYFLVFIPATIGVEILHGEFAGIVSARSHIVWGVERNIAFVRIWKPLPSKRVLKTLREAQAGKPNSYYKP